ncbi:DNA polymerase III subunit delta' [bacterium]|nr:MAG: DNA polymerase III subunit delta' [bacterium]
MAAETIAASTRAILAGHAALRARLATSLRAGRAAHACLFSGPSGIGKTAVALEYARLLLCDAAGSQPCESCMQCEATRTLQHPDLHLVFPYPPGAIKVKKSGNEPEEIDESGIVDKVSELIASIAADPFTATQIDEGESKSKARARLFSHSVRLPQIRSLLRKVSRRAYQASRKVYVIFHAESMNTQAQNALLKALEEPPPDGYFLLVAENDQDLLPTIRSRCQLIRLGKLNSEVIASALESDGVPSEQASIASKLADGSFLRARELSTQELSALQTDVIDYLVESARCDALELPKTVQKVQERLYSTDRSYFDFLNLFFRDAALYSALAKDASDKLVFRDLEDRIARVGKAYPEADFDAVMNAVDKSAEYISLGYTPDLVLYALSVRIHQALGRRAGKAPKHRMDN